MYSVRRAVLFLGLAGTICVPWVSVFAQEPAVVGRRKHA